MGDEGTIEKRHEHVFYTYGRMNPPTVGHRALIEQVIAEARGPAAGGGPSADVYIFPTSTQDTSKNPLPVARKVDILRQMFAGRPVRIINTSDCRVLGGVVEGPCTKPQDVVERLIQAGYEPENITLLVGEEERVGSFSFLKGRGINVRAVAGKRVVNAGNFSAATISATKVRQAARDMLDGDEEAAARFRIGINAAIPDRDLKGLAEEIVAGLAKPKTAKKRGGGRTRGKKLSRRRR